MSAGALKSRSNAPSGSRCRTSGRPRRRKPAGRPGRNGRTTFGEGAEVSFLFCDDARIRELNRQFRGKDKPTNVLSFPGAGATGRQRNFSATSRWPSRRSPAKRGSRASRCEDHCRHMIVHGFLHLLGYDHEEDAEAEEMEATEIRILRALGVEDPYRDDHESETEVNGRA